MGKYTTPMFLADQLGYHAAAYQKDLSGQTVVVVGANVGLGYEAAKHFSTMGAARVIMACRSKERGSEAVERTFNLSSSRFPTTCVCTLFQAYRRRRA